MSCFVTETSTRVNLTVHSLNITPTTSLSTRQTALGIATNHVVYSGVVTLAEYPCSALRSKIKHYNSFWRVPGAVNVLTVDPMRARNILRWHGNGDSFELRSRPTSVPSELIAQCYGKHGVSRDIGATDDSVLVRYDLHVVRRDHAHFRQQGRQRCWVLFAESLLRRTAESLLEEKPLILLPVLEASNDASEVAGPVVVITFFLSPSSPPVTAR